MKPPPKTPASRLDRALDTIAQILSIDNQDWWPHTQAQRTVLAQGIALEWANDDHLGAQGREVWISTCWGRDVELQRAVFESYGVKMPLPGHGSARKGNRRFSPRQLLLDFSIWPTDNSRSDEDVYLTMESEMYSHHRVDATVDPSNGYAYDFFKVLWCPSPRRLFVACVAGKTQRDELERSLNEIAQSNRRFIGKSDLDAVLLPSAQKARGDVRVGTWDHRAGCMDWQRPFLDASREKGT
jgi:hypothetical protein